MQWHCTRSNHIIPQCHINAANEKVNIKFQFQCIVNNKNINESDMTSKTIFVYKMEPPAINIPIALQNVVSGYKVGMNSKEYLAM